MPLGETIVRGTEEKIEYRDEHGNLLDEEQVKALEGKVSFQTKYETRTRVVDDAGNELYVHVQERDAEDDGAAEAAGVAPPHPDVEGADAMTAAEGGIGATEDEFAVAENTPASVEVIMEEDESREGVEEEEAGEAKPVNEVPEATGGV